MEKKKSKKKKVMCYAKKGGIERTECREGSRTFNLSQETKEILEEQRKRFIEKFGREPSPKDPVFFDPDADTPQPYSEEKIKEALEILVEDMRKAGVDERHINAWRKTGLFITPENVDLLPPEDIEEFEQALNAQKPDSE